MTNRNLLVTKEWIWVVVLLVVCSAVALWLVMTIPFVNKLPEGTSTVTEYVVNQTVSRFGIPVVAFLFFSGVDDRARTQQGQRAISTRLRRQAVQLGSRVVFSMGRWRRHCSRRWSLHVISSV